MKWFAFFLISAFACSAVAQDVPADTQTNNTPLTLAGGLLEHNFVNFYAFANGVYDTQTIPDTPNLSSWGEQFGGGVTAAHQFRDGSLSLDYRGDYTTYANGELPSGTDQNLSFGIAKQLNRRWSVSFYQAAGIFLYGGTYFSVEPVASTAVVTNPFSPETKFLNSGISLTYQQSRRLSFSFSGDFFLNRYNYAGAIGMTGGSGSLSASYRLTRRTSFGAGYSHNYFDYQRAAGTAQIDSVYLFVSHQFRSRWNGSLSAGVTRSNSVGTIAIPVTFLSNGQIITGYEIGRYNQTSNFPSFQGSLTHSLRHTQVSVSAGQGISPGNGFYLSSRNDFVNGFVSYGMRRSSLGFGGAYYRYSSVANAVSSAFVSASFSASYSVTLSRYLGTSVNYAYINYPQFGDARKTGSASEYFSRPRAFHSHSFE